MKAKILLILSVVLTHLLTSNDTAQSSEGLYYVLKDRRVYMHDVLDESKHGYTYGEHLKELLLAKLAYRAFENVSRPEDADIIIHCAITEFDYYEEDPIEHIYFPPAALIDAFRKSQYLRLKASFTVATRDGKVLWKRPVLGIITRKELSKAGNYPELNAKLVKVFIRECFSKGKSDRWARP